MRIRAAAVGCFRRRVRQYFRSHGRSFPWRETCDPYAILVSEIMLQQTQTGRVLKYYQLFLRSFPTIHALAAASTDQVIRLWQGLGYNRRAVALHRCARAIVDESAGVVPCECEKLCLLPGIGPYTGAAIATFAYDVRVPFIETNIRAVFLQEFFPRRTRVTDKEILALVAATLPKQRVREWYYALMDLGARIKEKNPTIGKRSAHYGHQSTFEGSSRQKRGAIVRALTERRECSVRELAAIVGSSVIAIGKLASDLQREGLIERSAGGGVLRLARR